VHERIILPYGGFASFEDYQRHAATLAPSVFRHWRKTFPGMQTPRCSIQQATYSSLSGTTVVVLAYIRKEYGTCSLHNCVLIVLGRCASDSTSITQAMVAMGTYAGLTFRIIHKFRMPGCGIEIGLGEQLRQCLQPGLLIWDATQAVHTGRRISVNHTEPTDQAVPSE
jgi:hypothetical protein